MEPKDRKEPLRKPEAEEDLSLSSETERAAMIASVMRDQATREEVRFTAPTPGRRPLLPQLVALALSTALAGYVWFGSPGWLEPDPIPLPPVAVEAATLRLQIFVQAQAIEHFRTATGRTPAFLEEAGPPRPGIAYRRLDGQTYLLQGQGDQIRLTYTSTDSLPAFLGADGAALLMGILDP